MKIYTKKGDAGETSLFSGLKVSKDDHRIRVYGTYDELNSVLGLALCEADLPADLKSRLARIQGELFQLGTELATPRGKDSGIALVDGSQVLGMETEIDSMESTLSPLKNFILPGGNRASAVLHLARTVSRRAERELVTLNRAEPQRAEVLQYANRLSDYFFVCARYANHRAGVTDVPWTAPRRAK